MDDDDALPPSLLARLPELDAVGEALHQHRRGEPVTARCHVCDRTLEVVEVPEAGVLVVACAEKHVRFRARRTPERS